MVCSCFVVSKGPAHRTSQAACSGKARKALLLAHPSNAGGHFISYALSRLCSHQRVLCSVMSNPISLDRGNTLHACGPTPAEATACGSSTIPRMQDAASPAYSHPIPQPLCPELPSPQKRPGVPVYVMLPLDTVSLLTFCQSKITTAGLLQRTRHPAGQQQGAVPVRFHFMVQKGTWPSASFWR